MFYSLFAQPSFSHKNKQLNERARHEMRNAKAKWLWWISFSFKCNWQSMQARADIERGTCILAASKRSSLWLRHLLRDRWRLLKVLQGEERVSHPRPRPRGPWRRTNPRATSRVPTKLFAMPPNLKRGPATARRGRNGRGSAPRRSPSWSRSPARTTLACKGEQRPPHLQWNRLQWHILATVPLLARTGIMLQSVFFPSVAKF